MNKLSVWVLILFSCTIVIGCKRTSDPPISAAKTRQANSLNVRVSEVQIRDLAYRIKTLGSLEAEEVIQVTAQVSGVVTDVHFESGDRITRDTVLLRIDPDRYRLEAERAEAEQRRALADWQRAEAEMKRREKLGKDGLISDEELFGARQETERLAAIAASAKAALSLTQQNLQRAEVCSPQAGIINTRSVNTGQFVQAGTVLATLVDTSRLRLRFKVSDAESLRVKKGQTVNFRVSSLGDRDFPAEIYYVGAVADATTRQVEILAWVNNPGVLKPGFFAEVAFDTELHKAALVVPERAVQASERGFVVYVVNGGHAKQRTVQVGLRTGDGTVEILSGLNAGETVVREGSDRLSDGIAVQPVDEIRGK